ncbi:hypothetical protein A2V71_01860 [Candidatus Berkelbacteria bacterium RBG_13_40_8]|uniref:GIY-YIG domain-containing protein n=1 Tax=Candidatus Berkelbacteria bacterium RBG_13_40_8 TaxID=1797467 RepID=A0A1F5DPV9_9BACT|nr:MAG: hypothetical protein A2V71_01860 [Candidatus Berkelbacteria bacterium RBG_13_40_8]
MFYIYLIQSTKDKSTYIGYTDNIERRLAIHNSGKVNYTSKHKPYRIVYFEAYLSQKDARKREQLLKNNGGQRDFLKENIGNSLAVD